MFLEAMVRLKVILEDTDLIAALFRNNQPNWRYANSSKCLQCNNNLIHSMLGWNDGLAFLFGLLRFVYSEDPIRNKTLIFSIINSVQWTVRTYFNRQFPSP